MEQIFHYIIPSLNFTVVSIIALQCLQLSRLLDAKNFGYVKNSWTLNAALVLINLFVIIEILPQKSDNLFVFILCLIINLLSSYFFLKLPVGSNKKLQVLSENKILFSVLVIIFSFLVVVEKTESLNHFQIYGRVLLVIISTLALVRAAYFFKQSLEQSEIKRYIFFPMLSYGLIQVLILYDNNILGFNSRELFYTITLILKLIILFGFQHFILHFAKIKTRDDTLELSNTKLNSIIGRTFHELAAPLQTIEGRIEDLIDNKSEFRINRPILIQLKYILSNYNRMSAVINAAIKMYESPSVEKVHELNIDREEIKIINVNTLIEISIISLKEFLGKNEESAVISREYSSNCNILGNENHITQIFYNLLKNAVEAFPDNTGSIRIQTKVDKIEVRTGEMQKFVTIIIEDDGRGIPTDKIEYIYQEGYTTKDGAGRGFGMTIVQTLVEYHGGSIKTESPPRSHKVKNNSGCKHVLVFPAIIKE